MLTYQISRKAAQWEPSFSMWTGEEKECETDRRTWSS